MEKMAMLFVVFVQTILGFATDVVPTAFMTAAKRNIVVSGEEIELDEAYCFDAWPGGEKPADAAQQEALWGDYANWNADFVVTFDRPVAAGTVALYGQTAVFGDAWLPLPIETSFESDKPLCLLKEGIGQSVPYLDIAEMIVRFECGVKNLSLANVGTTMTIELMLSDPDSASSRTLVARMCTFRMPKISNWFDARIADYTRWPVDAIKAVGGEWRSEDKPLDEAASLFEKGVLNVDSDGLDFLADEVRVVDEKREVIFSSDIAFDEYDLENIPAVDPSWKSGVLVVREDGRANYYGLARVGERNAWVKLDSPPVRTDGAPTSIRATLGCYGGSLSVRYVIDGTECSYSGKTQIPIVGSTAVCGVTYGGCGSVRSLSATVEKIKRGFALMLR